MGRGKVWLLAAAFALSFGGVVAAAPLLKLGAEGHDVRIVQAALQKAGYALDGVTGVFDEATRAAVLAFQRDQRLAESGEVDRATWHALRGAPPAKQAAPAPPQMAPAPAPSWETSSPKAKPPEKEASEKKPSAQADAGTAAPQEPKPAEPKPAEPKPAEPKPAEPKPAEPKPAEPKPAEPKPAEPKPAEPKPAEPKPAEPKPAEPKPAERKPAQPKEPERTAEKVPESAVFLPRKEVPPLIATARNYLGTPYRFGGTTPKGFDCSGFVQFVFHRHGFSIPRAADEQYRLGQRVKKRQDLEPGDLVFFSTYEKGASHCGIYLGKNQFIHVSSSRGVRVDSLDDAYWKPRWYGGKHIVK